MKPQTSKRVWIVRLSLLAAVNLIVIALVAAVAVVYGWTSLARRLPPLRGWHTEQPRSEFRAADARPGFTFKDYLAKEDRVFEELKKLETDWSKEQVGPYCRFQAESICYPETLDGRDWNRTVVMDAAAPAAAVLLVHGLSDSPYSLRTLGMRLHEDGCTVISMRVPGHGTCPAALSNATWEDWAAAVRVAMGGLRERVPAGTPLIMVGYSNGGALCVRYAALAMNDAALPRPAGMALYSPMIGISPLAEFTEIYPAVAAVSGEPKLTWSGIQPEIDPFKYSSWPINASLQGYRLTQVLETELSELAASGRMAEFPPVMAVQSAADSTVLVTRLIEGLMDRMPRGRGELVLFDINRASRLEGLVDKGFEKALVERLRRPDLPFTLSLVTNRDPGTFDLEERCYHAGKLTKTDLGIAWPPDVFSLSHVALPIPSDDPVYGADARDRRLPLGVMSARGELGVLAISESLLMRMRYNPLHEWTQGRVVAWIKGIAAGSAGVRPEEPSRPTR